MLRSNLVFLNIKQNSSKTFQRNQSSFLLCLLSGDVRQRGGIWFELLPCWPVVISPNARKKMVFEEKKESITCFALTSTEHQLWKLLCVFELVKRFGSLLLIISSRLCLYFSVLPPVLAQELCCVHAVILCCSFLQVIWQKKKKEKRKSHLRAWDKAFSLICL